MPFVKKTTTTTKRKVVRRRLVNKPSIARVVKRILNSRLETKVASFTVSYTNFNSAISANSEFYRLCPSLVPGGGQNQRIGDSVNPKRLEIMGVVSYNADTYATSQAIMARLFAFQDKSVRSYDNVAQVNAQLIDVGGTPSTYGGTLLNSISPLNRDRFQFYANKTFKFTKPYGITTGSSSTTAITSPFSSCKTFKIVIRGKNLPNVLKYGANDNNPENFAPYLALGYCYQQNNTPDVTDTKIGLSFVSTLYFTDA